MQGRKEVMDGLVGMDGGCRCFAFDTDGWAEHQFDTKTNLPQVG